MKNKDVAYLVIENKLPDISYRSQHPEEIIHPRIVEKEDGPYVYCHKEKEHISLAVFLTRLASAEPGLSVTGYRNSNRRQTTISFSKKDRVSISPRLQALLSQANADESNASTRPGSANNSPGESTGSGSFSLESDMVSESEPFLGTSENSIRQPMSIEEFQAQLDRRSETGQAGEQIAFDDELRRLKTDEVGCLDPERYIKHVALTDVGRGYDIESTWPGHERCIEVKSSTSSSNDIFMSENERSTLKALGNKAWLYRVVIDANGNGEVVLRLNDPISEIPEENFSTAVWRVRLPRPDK